MHRLYPNRRGGARSARCLSEDRQIMSGTNRYIGSAVERVEDFRFLRGRGEFVGDLRREGMLHAAILRSPVAHGRIRNLDAAAARAIPGARAVITAAEIGAVPRIPLRLLPLPGTERFLQPVIATDRVRYVGEPDEFAPDPERCREVAGTIREALANVQQGETIADLAGDGVEEAEEGRLITAMHRR